MITVYTKENCPKCKILKQKLKQKGVEYKEESNVDLLLAMGIDFLPVLQVDDEPLLNYKQAVEYVNSLEEYSK